MMRRHDAGECGLSANNVTGHSFTEYK
uniref:Uncharacterized protein n=1 Tax=Arundo donax TaxID=35708 RepID=A0A0A9FU82_ARUDO